MPILTATLPGFLLKEAVGQLTKACDGQSDEIDGTYPPEGAEQSCSRLKQDFIQREILPVAVKDSINI